MPLTSLADLTNKMDFYQSVTTIDEIFKIRALDDAIRRQRRILPVPWALKKTTLRTFESVLEYPTASDHDELAYIDVQQDPESFFYDQSARFKFTSLQQFYENVDPDRNTIAEIFNGNVRTLGVKYKDFTGISSTIDTAASITGYASSGDAGTPVLDQVFFMTGNSSIRIPVVLAANNFSVTFTNFSISDSVYQKKYFFLWIYLNSVPTNIQLKFGNDAANYLTKTITTQFSGQSFVAGDWNMIAFDLNTATTVGVINSSVFDYWSATVNGVTTGNYYIDSSFLREWKLMNYWYYSVNNVQSNGASAPDKPYFITAGTSTYSLDDSLAGDTEWSDAVMYDALTLLLTDKENENVLVQVKNRRDEAWATYIEKYPDMTPVMTTQKYRFSTDYVGDWMGGL